MSRKKSDKNRRGQKEILVKERGEKFTSVMRLKKRHYDEKTQSCIGDNHNSTFTRHNDLTALERQCLWPSCRIPISRVYATVEMKREQGLYRAPGLSDYCLKTRVFWPWQRVDRHRGSARSQLFSPFFQAEDFEELISSLRPSLSFYISDILQIYNRPGHYNAINFMSMWSFLN